jgi:hypothetical protein
LASRLLDSAGMTPQSVRLTGLGSLRNERGVALPMAMITLVVLTTLMLAFAVLGTSEPIIASNHSRTATARALADSGIERAAWALGNPTLPGGIPAAEIIALAPYDGTNFFALASQGGFTVQVTAGAIATERNVTSIGWSPNNTSPARAHRKVQVTLQQGPVRFLDPPCALCVNGNIQVGGSGIVDARGNGCGSAPPPTNGAMYTGAPPPVGPEPLGGNGKVYGYGDNSANGTTDILGGAPSSSVFTYTQSELDTLKAYAIKMGTYLRGAQNTLPADGGVIWIDTVDGTPFTSSTPDSNAGSLHLTSTGHFKGIIIVAGSVIIDGTLTIDGLVYALNDSTIAGNSKINGALVSENRRDTQSTNVDAQDTGNSTINFDCQKIRDGGGSVSTAWTIKTGTYFEKQD